MNLQKAIDHHNAGQFDQAESEYEKILSVDPNHPDALHLLGVLAYQTGNLDQAMDLIGTAIRSAPKCEAYYNSLGVVLNFKGSHAEAVSNYQTAVELNPRYADAYYNMGNSFQKQRKLAQAIGCYQQALNLSPNHVTAWYNMGIALKKQGEPEDAVRCYQQVLKQRPEHADAYKSIGDILKELGKMDAAVACYQKAIEAEPHKIEALVNLGSAFQDMGRFESARDCYRQAVAADSPYAAPYAGLACVMLSLGELTEVTKLKKIICSKLDVFLKNDSTRWMDELIYLSPLISLGDETRSRLTQKADQTLSGFTSRSTCSFPSNSERIRVGYVSPDFGDHPISHVLRGVFSEHDRRHFEVFAYSLRDRSKEKSKYYQDLVNRCDRFNDLTKLSDDDAADRIAFDGIHVLVDLAGYMKNARLEIFARRPAPVQMYWLGHGSGLGLSFMDYVIGDHIVIPVGAETLYREKIIRLPEVYHPADTPAISDAPVHRSDFGFHERAIVFCGFNNPQKINQEVFEAWMNILRQVQDGVLWLSNPTKSKELIQNLQTEADNRGVNPDRLIFAERLPDKSIHFTRHRLADLFLDTFSYNASTTAIDALWAGLPIVTRLGDDFYSRICASLLINVGLSDMICTTTEEYEARAISLANNPSSLAAIKKRLIRNRETEALFNTSRFVRHLESAYRTALDYADSERGPQNFDIPALPS